MTRKNPHNGLKILGATLTLVILCVVVLVVYLPSSLPKQSLIAISNVNLAPQGSATADGKWTGSYWTIAATTNMEDEYDAITFSNATSGTSTIGNFTIDPSATIQVIITPQQPYWTRSLNVQAYTVYPATQSYQQSKITQQHFWTGPSVPALDASVWTWGQSYWTAHTPFTITVLKNGVLWANETVDTGGKTEAIQIVDPNDASQWITLNNVGVLSTSYQSPPNLPDVAMLSSSEIFANPNSVINEVNYYSGSDYTYADYWFGGGQYYTLKDAGGLVEHTAPDGSPGFFTLDSAPFSYDMPIDATAFPGAYSTGDLLTYKISPRAASLSNDQSFSDWKTAYGLYQYLSLDGGAAGPIQTVSSNAMNVYGAGWDISSMSSSQQPGQYAGNVNELMPDGAMSSLITIQISTGLADAVVERTPVSDGVVTGGNWLGGANDASASIGDTSVLYVDVTQKSTVASSIYMSAIATTGDNIFLNPSSQTLDLNPGQSEVVPIQVLNNGAPSKQQGTVTVTLSDELGDVTSTWTIAYTLLQKGVNSTQLTVYTEDGTTNQLISGISVTVGWGTNSQLETSGSNGQGAFTMDLQGYTGAVSIVSTATNQYNSSQTTVTIGAGPNTATLLIYKYGKAPTKTGIDWPLILIIAVAFIAAVLVAVGVYYAYAKKKKKKR